MCAQYHGAFWLLFLILMSVMESGLASRTIPMDRHRFSFPRPNRFEVSTHIKNKDYIVVKKISEKSIPPRRLVNSYRIVSDAVITFVSCIVATIGNVYLIITNFEKCQISHPGEFFNFPSSLIWARNYFSLHFFYLHTSKASIKNASLLVFLWNAMLCVFFCLALVNSHPYKHVNFLLYVRY